MKKKTKQQKQRTSQGRPGEQHTHTPLIGCAARVPSLNYLLLLSSSSSFFQLWPAATYEKKKRKKKTFFFSFLKNYYYYFK
jgi:hypothetical protein